MNQVAPFALRELPKSPESEQAVLGALLINNDVWSRIGGFLEPRHFSEFLHQRIYETASALIREGKVASPLTLRTYLGDEDLGGLALPVARTIAALANLARTLS